jgi:tetratricopeptide (TPR) repeat protein
MIASSAQLSQEADRAALRGDMAEARKCLEAAIEGGWPDIDLSLKLAAICRAMGDFEAALAATEGGLATDPLNFVALLLRANLLERLGRPESGEAYGQALAQRPSTTLPPQLDATARHGQARYAAYQAERNRTLADAMAAHAGRLSADEAARLARFRTNALRLTNIYHSEPADYHYPGLREREFHERASFAWLAAMEAATDAIGEDFERVASSERAELVPYIQYPAGQPVRQWAGLNHSSEWSAIHLLRNGVRVEPNARHCPATMALLARLPQPQIPGASPNAMFSLLAPHTHIPPHTGIANTRLVCHLPLVVPAGCWFRVGADRREWRRGEAWVFDDTIEHEAANESDALRVVLICDVWHPDLTEAERLGVAKLVSERDRVSNEPL